MANIIRLGGGSNGGSEIQSLAIHEGKINTSGVVVSDSDYYYTDSIPCPKGRICLDFGDIYNSNAMIAFYDTDDSFIDYWGSTARYRVLDFTSDYQAGRKMKLSFPKTALTNVEYIDFEAFAVYSGNPSTKAVLIGGSGGGGSITYEDLTNLDNYFNRNTTTPVITHVDSDTVDIDFTINNASGYEGTTVSLPLSKGLYICEFDITLGTDSVNTYYGWGVYTANANTSDIASNYENWTTINNAYYNNYVPFVVTTAKQHVKVPIKMNTNGTAYICFAVPGINTSTADVSIENLKIYNGVEKRPQVPSLFDKVIDWTLYSHPSAFDSISLPANYTDYDHLAFIGVQALADQDYIEEMAMKSVEHYLESASLDTQIYVINTSDISASDYSFHFPLMDANTYAFSIWTDAVINSSRILGTNYSWAWQDLYLLVIGFND